MPRHCIRRVPRVSSRFRDARFQRKDAAPKDKIIWEAERNIAMLKYNTGALVVYHGKSAQITGLNGDKIEIRIEGGVSKSVRTKDLEYLHPGPVTALPPREMREVDCAEIAELIEGETIPFPEFAALLYSENTPDAFWGAWKILAQGIYFTGTLSGGVKARAKEEVEAELAAERAKNEAKEHRAALLERMRAGTLLPEDRPLMSEIEQLALGRSENSRLMRELGIEATPEKAHRLLLRLGVWDELADPYPERAGIELGNPEFPLPAPPCETREDLTGMISLAVDNEGSADPDDAIGFADGLLWVHVADPASVVTDGSEIDLECRRRGANLYLPETIVHMLPPEATRVFGLGLNETSPALSFAVRIGDDGHAVLEKCLLSTVRVERLTYAGAAARMEETPLREISEALERFRRRREQSGALFIRLPETDIRLKDARVEVTPVEVTPERELVANAMLAAGAAVAEFAVRQELAMPFAVQPPIEGERPDEKTLSGMYALRRLCPPSTVRTSPGLHAGLGLDPYVRVTSPLRRYVDLLAHRQLRRWIAGEPPLTEEELEERISSAEKESALRRKLERQADDFWMQVFFRQNPDWSGEAVLVNRIDDRLTFLIPSLAYEFKTRGGGKLEPGDSVRVGIQSADPTTLTARFRIEP